MKLMSHHKRLVAVAAAGIALVVVCASVLISAPMLAQTEVKAVPQAAQSTPAQPKPTQPVAALMPTAQVKPAVTGTATLLSVHGLACVDLDQDGQCSADEARVPNVILRSAGGGVAVTDQSGQYAIEALEHSALDITAPEGFRSSVGNLRRLNQLLSSDHVDVALAVDKRAGGATRDAAPLGMPDSAVAYAALAGIGSVALASFCYQILSSFGLRRVYRKLLSQQEAMFRDQRAKDVLAELQTECGWQAVAGRIVADALRQSVVIDAEAGIIDASAEPVMKFTLITDDGSEVVFTTNPQILRKTKLIRPGDRVVDVTAISPANGVAADVLWNYVLDARNMRRVAPPASAHWHVVLRSSSTRLSVTGDPSAGAISFARPSRAARGSR